MTSLGSAAVRDGDNYLPLRHVAALMVIFGHSQVLAAHGPGTGDPVARWMPGFDSGTLAVYLFFAISGYLVTGSLLRNPGLWRYVRNRFLRVYPGYLACLLATVLVIGPCFTSLLPAAYLRAPGTWDYLAGNLQPITLAWTLPGVFAHNPYPDVVNGSLWSLGLEVRWYAYLGLLAALTIVRRRWAFTAVALAVLCLGAWEWWSGKADVNHYRALSQTYLLAAVCAHWRDRIPLSHWAMLALAALALVAHGSRWFGPAVVCAALYLTFWSAYALPVLRWPGHRDYSYGLFLFGFPVQQSLMAAFPALAPWQLFVAAVAVTTPVAIASWHWVERPALRFARRPPAAAPLPAV